MKNKPIGTAVIAAVLAAGTLTAVANADYVGAPVSSYASATEPKTNPFNNSTCSVRDFISGASSQNTTTQGQSIATGAYRMYSQGTVENNENRVSVHTVQIGNEINGTDQFPRYRESLSLTVPNTGEVPLVAQSGSTPIGTSVPTDNVYLDDVDDIGVGETRQFQFGPDETAAYQ